VAPFKGDNKSILDHLRLHCPVRQHMSRAEQMADLKGLDIDHGNRIEVANLIPFLKNLARLTEDEIVRELSQYATDVKVQANSDGFIGSFDLIRGISCPLPPKMQHDKIAALKYFAEWFSDGECCMYP
jgi:hypothetical protein